MTKIVFDPAKLDRSSKAAVISFPDSEEVSARFARIYDEMNRTETAYWDSVDDFKRSGGRMSQFKYDWSGIVTNLQRHIEQEKNKLLRQELLFRYLMMSYMGVNVDTSIVAHFLEVDSSMSAMRSLELPFYMHKDPVSYANSWVLYNQMMYAKSVTDSIRMAECFTILVDRYPSTPYGRWRKHYILQTEGLRQGKKLRSTKFLP